MSPKKVVFDRKAILAAALRLVRDEGWESLTARRLADRLEASVAPVYKAFGAMAELERAVLEEIRGLLEERTRRPYTEMDFLNIGTGVVEFARDEPNLFRALYQTRHARTDIVQAVTEAILARMRQQPLLESFGEASLRRLLDRLRLYTLGMAAAVVAGWWTEASTEAIVSHLMDVGNLFTLAEAAQIAECRTPQAREAWFRALGGRNLGEGACPMAPGPAAPPPDQGINNNRFFEED